MNKDGPTEATTTGNNPEPLHCGYKETFVQEYDGMVSVLVHFVLQGSSLFLFPFWLKGLSFVCLTFLFLVMPDHFRVAWLQLQCFSTTSSSSVFGCVEGVGIYIHCTFYGIS